MTRSATAFRVENVGKQYRLGQVNRHRTIRESVTETVSSSTRRLHARLRGAAQHRVSPADFWALKDVSFEVARGEVLGIIGRNGAGKSTLLKILSRVTEPTTGRIEMFGRVGSLLEVGTGFHPELTGRENIFLNGAILGMSRAEIGRKFDEIVAFAEVEEFLDTPVKRYSSGMYVRLAFAVAAHLEPEILLVDEVLAVGDVQFQRKCVAKMSSVAREGRTVLFVSHNLGMIRSLCRRGILLRQGTMATDGEIEDVVAAYLAALEAASSENLLDREERQGRGAVRIARIDVLMNQDAPGRLATGRPARFVFHLTDATSALTCSFTIYDQTGQPVSHLNSAAHSTEDTVSRSPGARVVCEIDELPLLPGRYRIDARIATGNEIQDRLEAAAYFDVEEGIYRGRPLLGIRGYGQMVMDHRWVLPAGGSS